MKNLIFIFIFIFTYPMHAEITNVILGTYEYYPYSSKDSSIGSCTEIILAAFEEEQVKVELVFFPWLRLEDKLLHNQIDAIFPYSSTKERQEKYLFSNPIIQSKTVLFYYGYTPVRNIDSLANLKPYSVIANKGYFYEEDLKAHNIQVVYSQDENNAFELLAMQRADFHIQNLDVGYGIAKKIFLDKHKNFEYIKNPLYISDLTIMISKTNPKNKEILAIFNRGLKKIKANGKYEKIVNQYR